MKCADCGKQLVTLFADSSGVYRCEPCHMKAATYGIIVASHSSDDEPITNEWVALFDGYPHHIFLPDDDGNGTQLQICVDYDGSPVSLVMHDVSPRRVEPDKKEGLRIKPSNAISYVELHYRLPHIRTRGDLQLLLAALGWCEK